MRRIYTYKGTIAGLAHAMNNIGKDLQAPTPFLSKVADGLGAACAVAIVYALACL